MLEQRGTSPRGSAESLDEPAGRTGTLDRVDRSAVREPEPSPRTPPEDGRSDVPLTSRAGAAVTLSQVGFRSLAPSPGSAARPRSRRSPATRRAVLVGDLVALAAAGGVGAAIEAAAHGAALDRRLAVVLLFPVGVLSALVLLGQYRGKSRSFRPSGFADVGDILLATTAGSLLASGAATVLVRGREGPPLAAVAATAGSAALLVLALRPLAYHWSRRRPVRVLIVGSGTVASSVRDRLARDPGAVVVGFVDDDPAPPTEVLGPTALLPALCRDLRVDRVLVSFSRTHPKDLTDSLRALHGLLPIGLVPRFFELLSWRSEVDDLSGMPIIDVAAPSPSRFDRAAKRTFDIVASLVLLVVLSPVLALLAAAVKLTSPGPAFVEQPRVGLGGRPFRLYRLRTMWRDAEEVAERLRLDARDGPGSGVEGSPFSAGADPLVTPIGRWLRRYSLDELPQLLDVLSGKMSLVGPRPLDVALSESMDGWAARRFEVRPGLTGLWQVSGRNDLSQDDLRRLDYQYVASWSLTWDLKILWQTPEAVVRGHGAA